MTVQSSDRFLLPTGKRGPYGQYSNIYFSRMKQQQFPLLALSKIKSLEPDAPVFYKYLTNQACWITGSVYKQQNLKANILSELIAHAAPIPDGNVKKIDDDDEYALEDETGRYIAAYELFF